MSFSYSDSNQQTECQQVAEREARDEMSLILQKSKPELARIIAAFVAKQLSAKPVISAGHNRKAVLETDITEALDGFLDEVEGADWFQWTAFWRGTVS